MKDLDTLLRIGETVTIGSHTFSPEAIKAFAAKYDPQPFHLDEDAAARSVFGGLCASGWHTASAWMRCNVLHMAQSAATPDGAALPVFGPSPGFSKLRWLKPVMAGETVTYTRRALGHRPLASRPGWRLLTVTCEGFDSTGDKVIEFESMVLVKTD